MDKGFIKLIDGHSATSATGSACFGCQQVTILEVKNKQQLRLLQQLRGVRNSLMQLLQETKANEADSNVTTVGGMETPHQHQEVAKLKAGMKASQAHVKELEAFIDEM